MPPDAADADWLPLGDAAVLVPGVTLLAGATRNAPAGVLDAVSAFANTAVYFDPLQVESDRAAQWARSAAAIGEGDGQLVELPVCYDAEFGPDLDRLAREAGLSIDEVVRRYYAAEYSVGAIGFRPGFAYLVGLDERLHASRLADPRTAVPAGSVAIGGEYTGVYPDASPGGWNVIGRTPRRMHDPRRQPPSLVAAGNRVRFRPIDRARFDEEVERSPLTPPTVTVRGEPTLRVVSPGALTSLHSSPRHGRRPDGVPAGGAMDPWSHRLANLLAGEAPDATTLEATLTGPVLEAIRGATLGVAGAVATARRVRLEAGERLDLRRLEGGARAYVAVAGGFTGEVDRRVVSDEVLHRGEGSNPPVSAWSAPAARIDSPTVLRFVPGPDLGAFSGEPWERFVDTTHRISARSDRMGVRLETPIPAPRWPTNAASRPTAHGAIQTPPDGRPIVLGADCQTIGGYPVIGCVASVDWPTLGQLRPGDRVRFRPIDLPEAIDALRKQEAEFLHLGAGVAAHDAR